MITKVAWWHPVLDHNRRKKKKEDIIDHGLSLDFYQKEAWNAEGQSLLQGKDIKTFQQELFAEGDWVHAPKIYNLRSIEFHTQIFQNKTNTERKDLTAKILKADRNRIEIIGLFDRQGMSEIWYSPVQASLKIHCLLDLGWGELWWRSWYL